MVHVARPFDCSSPGKCRHPRFEVHTDRCPQVVARAIGLLAARALIPTEFHMRQSCGGLWLAFHVDVDPHTAERLAEKLRAMVSVAAVILIHDPAKVDRSRRPVEATAQIAMPVS